MKIILDDIVNDELKEYLLMQDGLSEVLIDRRDFLTELNIRHNNNFWPEMIMNYIELFQKNKNSILFGFDKETDGKFKVLKYVVNDMCCDYCYRGLVLDLFKNENIKSVKSNFDYDKPPLNIEFIIEYKSGYKEEELLGYFKTWMTK